MASMRSFVRGFRLSRTTLRLLGAIEARLAEQNRYLARLADHFAPLPPANASAPSASVDFVNDGELIRTMDYARTFATDQGRPPTEEEIERFLEEQTEQTEH